MPDIQTLSAAERQSLASELETEYQQVIAQNLSLDMTRGKPSQAQLDLSSALLDLPGDSYTASNGQDCRNYGGLDGLPEMKSLFARMMDAPVEQVIVGGNASLILMHDTIARACLYGVADDSPPWVPKACKFLCPSPGYDRHFAITEALGFELLPVSMTDDGPDMDQVEALVANDDSIKGIWCVPKFSNPTGCTYSDEVVTRLASMSTRAADFRIMWDNAYGEHVFDGPLPRLKNVLEACAQAGNPDRPYVFASTSKISFASAGVAAFASSAANVAHAKKHLAVQTIGPDKLNQLRHMMLFKDYAGLQSHMQKHAALLKPRFDKVQEVLSANLDGWNVATWTQPKGGYFTSLDLRAGSASQVIQRCADAGVKLTQAGATFPYGKDPEDNNIRIAPSFPSIDEIEAAMRVCCLCIKIDALS